MKCCGYLLSLWFIVLWRTVQGDRLYELTKMTMDPILSHYPNHDYPVYHFTFAAFGKNFQLDVAPSSGAFAEGAVLTVYSRNGNVKRTPCKQYLRPSGLVGQLAGVPHSFASGHLTNDRYFTGAVTSGDEVLFIELNPNSQDKRVAVHRLNDMPENDIRRHQVPIPTKKVCQIKIVVDHTFYQEHGGSISNVLFQVRKTIDAADARLRATDFDGNGRPDGIGLKVAAIDLYESNRGYPLHKVDLTPIEILNRASSLDFDGFCAGLVFTSRNPGNSEFGLASPKPGVCWKQTKGNRGTQSTHIAYITNKKQDRTLMTSQEFSNVLLHHLGYLFGSKNDNSYPECDPTNRYIMSVPFLLNGQPSFSPCSRRSIKQYLEAEGGGRCLEACADSHCSRPRKSLVKREAGAEKNFDEVHEARLDDTEKTSKLDVKVTEVPIPVTKGNGVRGTRVDRSHYLTMMVSLFLTVGFPMLMNYL